MKKERGKRLASFLQIVGVQSLICALVLLAVLLFRLAGNDAFGELRKGFREAMQENTWLSVVVSLLEGEVSG